MARKKKSRSGKSRSKKTRTWSLAGISAYAPQIRLGFTITASIAAIIVAGVGLARADAAVKSSLNQTETVVRFEWPKGAGGDTWLPASFKQELLDVAYAVLDRDNNPLSGKALAELGHALDATGWFESITAITREPDATIRIQGRWRLPVAVVRFDDLDYVVDANGTLLPPRYKRGESSLRVVLGSREGPPITSDGALRHGHPWAEASVGQHEITSALNLLALLKQRPAWAQVEGVDVSRLRSQGNLEIVTDRGTRVIWGAPPNEAAPGEIPDESKLQRIDTLLNRFGRIDASRNRIEVYGPQTLIDDSAAAK